MTHRFVRRAVDLVDVHFLMNGRRQKALASRINVRTHSLIVALTLVRWLGDSPAEAAMRKQRPQHDDRPYAGLPSARDCPRAYPAPGFPESDIMVVGAGYEDNRHDGGPGWALF